MAIDPYLAAGAGGMIGGGLASMFGNWTNPADEAMPYLEGLPGQMKPYFDPWIDAGKRQIPGLEDEYGKLTGDPGAFINNMGKGYQQSPGFEFAMKRALGAANQSSAAGGMAGSPAAQEWSQGIASNMAAKDYNNWLQNALGAYNRGLSGRENMFGTGAKMGADFGNTIGNVELQKALLKYMGQNAENQREGEMWGALGSGIGAIGSALAFSSQALKDRVDTPSTSDILNNVRELSLDRWKYKGVDQAFLGPYAEEFTKRFGVGDGKTINLIDAVGVLLGAVKELDKKIMALQQRG